MCVSGGMGGIGGKGGVWGKWHCIYAEVGMNEIKGDGGGEEGEGDGICEFWLGASAVEGSAGGDGAGGGGGSGALDQAFFEVSSRPFSILTSFLFPPAPSPPHNPP